MVITNINLPKDFIIDDNGHLFYKEEHIANGYPVVLHHTITQKPSGQQVISVELCFNVNGTEYIQVYSMNQLEKAKFLEVPMLYLEHPRTQSLELFKQTIRFQLSLIKPSIVYEINQLGYSVVNEKRVYCFGNKLIGPSDLNTSISEDLKRFELQYTRMEDQSLACGLNKFLALNPSVSLAMMSYLVLGLSRQLFIDAGVPVHFVLFITGRNQSFKTTLSCLFFNLYNRHEDMETHLYNFSSTKARLVQALNQVKDASLVFDDLNKSDSASIMRKQEETVSSLIQMAANNVGKQTMRDSYKIAGQLVFCGEYTLKNMSTNNRTVLLQFSSELFEKQKIKELQEQADVIPQFAEEFVSWSLEHYDTIVSWIDKRNKQFLTDLGKENTNEKRLATSINILRIAFELFASFCEQKGWQNLVTYAEKLPIHLTNLMCEQIEALNLEGEKEDDLCCELFFALHDRFYNDLPEEKPTKKFVPPVYYDIKNELLCIKGNFATEVLFERIGKVINYPKIFNEFYKMDFLITDKCKDNNRTKQIGKCKSRYYCIRYLDWKSYVREMVEDENYGC